MNLPKCLQDVFTDGQPIFLASTGPAGGNISFEAWVKEVAKKSGQKVDWHYSGGIAQVLFLGDRDAVIRAINSIDLPNTVTMSRLLNKDEPGRYRNNA